MGETNSAKIMWHNIIAVFVSHFRQSMICKSPLSPLCCTRCQGCSPCNGNVGAAHTSNHASFCQGAILLTSKFDRGDLHCAEEVQATAMVPCAGLESTHDPSK